MTVRKETTDLPQVAPGAAHQLISYTFDGSGETPRSAYIQAGLHADEHPGLLVVHHLLRMLTALDKDARVKGRVVVLPFANPIGMSQRIFGMPTGRFNLENGENFNRHFPSIAGAVEQALGEIRFERNEVAPFKSLFDRLLAAHEPRDPVRAMKSHLLREALRHDILLDLHCDTSGILHLYSTRVQQARALRLAKALRIEAVFLEDRAGGGPFDEAFMEPWNVLSSAGLVDAEHSGFGASIELRGQGDVSDELAIADAQGILRFLAAESIIDYDERDTDGEVEPRVYPLEGVSHVSAPSTGIVVYRKQPGDAVARGDAIAEIVRIDALPDAPRDVVLSDVDGLFVVAQHFKLVKAGQRIALLAGMVPLPGRKAGNLLNDF
ncbi:Succinylglutamate desuccinylase [Paraburkholderia caribensis]|uniref:succinylglutamate desuccinylase/aspartoacylase family protein n=1 Tax=Paraburkholderia caribensis TaxID=75105 RepID=UPI001CAE7C2D|nr:succinylglutamate desuccinylase/aspartoacylase family protein [Paraburkholderia caribensis]CAG9219145.1 Succinylglutamate desuccinylase [Paraburkholderia caribensis]